MLSAVNFTLAAALHKLCKVSSSSFKDVYKSYHNLYMKPYGKRTFWESGLGWNQYFEKTYSKLQSTHLRKGPIMAINNDSNELQTL